jgi:hypothetical protein
LKKSYSAHVEKANQPRRRIGLFRSMRGRMSCAGESRRKDLRLPALVRRESEHAVIAHGKKDQSGDCEDGDNGMV